MILTNHHAHSTFSDGKAPPEDFLLRAIERGFTTYGFSDHAPLLIPNFGIMQGEQLAPYLAEVDRLRATYADRIEVFKSLEVDYVPGVLNVNTPHIAAAGLDYTVGAVHYLETLDGYPWSFQRPEPSFSRGIDEIFGGSARAMVERYFELVREMVQTHPPDIVAHLDRIKKRNPEGDYWDERADWFEAEVDRTLAVIKRAGCILEVNTRGIYKEARTETYPSRWIVERAHALGIPLQVNSDAHEVENIDGGFDFAYGMLRELGVAEVMVFRGGRFVPLQLSSSPPA